MNLTGEMLIGAAFVRGAAQSFSAVNAATGAALEPSYGGATEDDVARACTLAASAFYAYREKAAPEIRVAFLSLTADKIDALGDALTDRACAETGLPRARIEGESSRTVSQLRLFAEEINEGSWQDVRIKRALPHRSPPRPDLRLRMIPLALQL